MDASVDSSTRHRHGAAGMQRIRDALADRYTVAYGAAILLHLLFFALYLPMQTALIRSGRAQVVQDARPPAVFEFVEVPRQQPEERPPESTPLLADRQSVARDRTEAALPPSHLPHSEGLVEAKEQPETRPGQEGEGGEGSEGEAQERPEESGQSDASSGDVDGAVDFAGMLKKGRLQQEQRQAAVYGRPAIPPSVQMRNRESSAREHGDFQLSTYDWEFAPYLAYLKRHIRSNVNPPAAFSQYGLIKGKTLLRFRILRDGRLETLEMLGFQGSPLLRDTSSKAVSLSAPFRALPADFPDPYLEVTGLFEYVIIRDDTRRGR